MAEKNSPKQIHEQSREQSRDQSRGVRRIPQQSVLYERIVPIAFIAMGVLLVGIVLVALAFLLGVIRY